MATTRPTPARIDVEAAYGRIVKNRRTNLGVLVLLASMACLGWVGAILQAGYGGGPFRYGMALGFAVASSLALLTFSALVIKRGKAASA